MRIHFQIDNTARYVAVRVFRAHVPFNTTTICEFEKVVSIPIFLYAILLFFFIPLLLILPFFFIVLWSFFIVFSFYSWNFFVTLSELFLRSLYFDNNDFPPY